MLMYATQYVNLQENNKQKVIVERDIKKDQALKLFLKVKKSIIWGTAYKRIVFQSTWVSALRCND